MEKFVEYVDQYRTGISIFGGTVLVGWLFNKFWINRSLLRNDLTARGKTVLITGGNTGIGYETAKGLLQRGARVIIACRNMNKGDEAREKLLRETHCSPDNIRVMNCDLSSLDSIRKFVRLFDHEEERLDILICNAGSGYTDQKLTADGFHPIIQANYLGHFLLTNLLLEKLKKCRPARILNVSSDLHKATTTIDWSDALTQQKKPGFWGVYAPSKLFQILSTYKFKKDLFDEGVDVFALTPGIVATSIKDPIEESVGFFASILYYPLTYIFKFLLAKTPDKGAQTSIYCAIEPRLEKSKDLYFQNCSVCSSSPLSTDPVAAENLWTISTRAVGL